MKILLTGGSGQVGWELQRTFVPFGEMYALGRHELELASPECMQEGMRKYRADLVVSAVAYTEVDRAEVEPQLSMAINGPPPWVIA